MLVVLAVLALTGTLGATDKSDGASDAAKSAGAGSSASADPSASDESAEPDGSGTPSASDGSTATEDKAPLTVLNGGGAAGLAAAAQSEFEDGGWEVADVGNYTEQKLEQSTVFYPADDEDAQAAAQALAEQFPELTVDEAPSSLDYNGVVVVLTGDWTPGQ